MGKKQIYSGTKKERNNQAVKKYQRSEKGEINKQKQDKKWRQSEKGKKYRQGYKQEYYQTINGYLRHVFYNIKRRCNNSNCETFKNYGGRGIKCVFTINEFIHYVVNVLEVDPRGLTVDRIDNNGHYEKDNIRFVTYKENNNNKRKKYG